MTMNVTYLGWMLLLVLTVMLVMSSWGIRNLNRINRPFRVLYRCSFVVTLVLCVLIKIHS